MGGNRVQTLLQVRGQGRGRVFAGCQHADALNYGKEPGKIRDGENRDGKAKGSELFGCFPGLAPTVHLQDQVRLDGQHALQIGPHVGADDRQVGPAGRGGVGLGAGRDAFGQVHARQNVDKRAVQGHDAPGRLGEADLATQVVGHGHALGQGWFRVPRAKPQERGQKQEREPPGPGARRFSGGR